MGKISCLMTASYAQSIETADRSFVHNNYNQRRAVPNYNSRLTYWPDYGNKILSTLFLCYSLLEVDLKYLYSRFVIELYPRFSVKARSKRPSTGLSNKNTEYGCVFGVLRAPSRICSLSHTDP